MSGKQLSSSNFIAETKSEGKFSSLDVTQKFSTNCNYFFQQHDESTKGNSRDYTSSSQEEGNDSHRHSKQQHNGYYSQQECKGLDAQKTQTTIHQTSTIGEILKMEEPPSVKPKLSIDTVFESKSLV